MVLPYLLLFLAIGPSLILGQSYQTYPECVPICTAASYSNPPISGGPPCQCRRDAYPSGCTLAPCGPGDEINNEDGFLCICTLYFVPEFCVTPRCDNGTTSYAAIYSSCPAYSVLPGSYPTQSYPSQGYPSSSYPSSGYPSSNYPSSSYPASNYPSPSYPTSNYPSTATCSNYCFCIGPDGDQPDDCTEDDDGPLAGGDFCACNMDFWPEGCTLKQCQSGDDMWCECSPEFNGSHCYGPRCTV